MADLLVGHEVRTVPQMGWTRLGNGALLRQAAAEFHAVLTAENDVAKANLAGILHQRGHPDVRSL